VSRAFAENKPAGQTSQLGIDSLEKLVCGFRLTSRDALQQQCNRRAFVHLKADRGGEYILHLHEMDMYGFPRIEKVVDR